MKTTKNLPPITAESLQVWPSRRHANWLTDKPCPTLRRAAIMSSEEDAREHQQRCRNFWPDHVTTMFRRDVRAGGFRLTVWVVLVTEREEQRMKTTSAPQVFKQGRHIIAYEPGPYRGTGLWVWYELEVNDGPVKGVHATAPNCQELQRQLNQHLSGEQPSRSFYTAKASSSERHGSTSITALQAKARRMTREQLEFAAQDAFEAACYAEDREAAGLCVGKSAGYYRDEVSVYRAMLRELTVHGVH